MKKIHQHYVKTIKIGTIKEGRRAQADEGEAAEDCEIFKWSFCMEGLSRKLQYWECMETQSNCSSFDDHLRGGYKKHFLILCCDFYIFKKRPLSSSSNSSIRFWEKEIPKTNKQIRNYSSVNSSVPTDLHVKMSKFTAAVYTAPPTHHSFTIIFRLTKKEASTTKISGILVTSLYRNYRPIVASNFLLCQTASHLSGF